MVLQGFRAGRSSTLAANWEMHVFPMVLHGFERDAATTRYRLVVHRIRQVFLEWAICNCSKLRLSIRAPCVVLVQRHGIALIR